MSEENKKISEQQTQTDHCIEEILPSEYACPICGSRAIQVHTKRGVHYKCQNDDCKWDSNRPFDFSKSKRHQHIEHCINSLKTLFPKLNFVENFGYNPNMIFNGSKIDQPLKYDISVFFMGAKLQRIRVELNKNLTNKRFFESEYCYVIGRPEVVEYLAVKKGLVVHFLVDEPKHKIGISRMDIVKKHCKKETDNFGNLQYFIPKDNRKLIVTFDILEIENLLFQGFHRYLYRNLIFR